MRGDGARRAAKPAPGREARAGPRSPRRCPTLASQTLFWQEFASLAAPQARVHGRASCPGFSWVAGVAGVGSQVAGANRTGPDSRSPATGPRAQGSVRRRLGLGANRTIMTVHATGRALCYPYGCESHEPRHRGPPSVRFAPYAGGDRTHNLPEPGCRAFLHPRWLVSGRGPGPGRFRPARPPEVLPERGPLDRPACRNRNP
jgi:hypothetical protein